MIKKIITKILALEAKIALRRHSPKVIGITGSVGKSSAKEAVAAVLESRFNVRKSVKSYNSELGMALAILDLKTAWNNPLGWVKNIIYGFKEILNKNFPKILILEMGVDRPSDFDKLLKIARPNIGIITAIGEIPVHVEFFAGPEEIAREKSKLIKNLSSEGWAILNFDDATVLEMREKTNANVLSFGFGGNADILASNYKIFEDGLPAGQAGISFKIDYKGSSVPVRLKKVFGKHSAYAALSAAAVGIIFEMNLIEISEALSKYQAPPGRLRLLPGIKNSLILDDSYNASPLAAHAALNTLQELEAVRKIVAFGDMLEIGKFTIEAHKAVGKKVAKIADYFIAVGPRSRFAAEEAVAQGMEKSKVINFSTSQEAAIHLKSIIQEGDLILVKGSQSMRMEKIVEEIMAEPEMAGELLARQDKFWKNKY